MMVFKINGVRSVTYAVPWVKSPPAVGTAESGPNCEILRKVGEIVTG